MGCDIPSGNVVRRNDTMFATLIQTIRKLGQDEDGAAAIEYGLIAAGIALLLVTAITPIGTSLAAMFGRIATGLGAG